MSKEHQRSVALSSSSSSGDDSATEVVEALKTNKRRSKPAKGFAVPKPSTSKIHPIAPAKPLKASDLFGTDSEGEEDVDACSSAKKGGSREKKHKHSESSHHHAEAASTELSRKRKHGHASTSGRIAPPPTPTSSPAPAPAPASSHVLVPLPARAEKRKFTSDAPAAFKKSTARDMFGSEVDSDDDIDERSCKPVYPSNTSSSDTNIDYKVCSKCNMKVPRNQFHYHLRTNVHKSNCLLSTEFQKIDIITTAFKNRIMTYRLKVTQEDEYLTPEAFLKDNECDLIKLIQFSLKQHNCIKINFELFAYYMLPKPDEQQQQLKSFNTKFEIVYQSTDLTELITNTIDTFKEKLSEFQDCQSGWTYISMSHLEININKYNPVKGGTYLKLPPIIRNTKSCINIQNKDDYCFLWSIIAELFPAKHNVCRTKSYPHYSTILNTKGMSFPPSHNDIKLFELNNPTISINIYGLDEKCVITGPLYKTNLKKINHVNLLYIQNKDKAHYCLIKDLVRLVRRQVTQHKGKVYFCDACLQFFTGEAKYTSHNCSNILTILPKNHTILKFKNYVRTQKINFIIYADFESLLENCKEKANSECTQNINVHQPSCFGYYICCSHDSRLNKYVSYRGVDCAEVFIKCLIKDAKRIHKILSNKKPMNPLSAEQEFKYLNESNCHICNYPLFNDRVHDHDHITGEYRGAAHSHCNLLYKVCPFIPVVFHNLSGYDSHIFMKELAKCEGSLRIIPKTKEKYLTITKEIKTKESYNPIQIKFIDSFQFLSSSLDSLSKSLSEKDFTNLTREFNDNEQLKLMKKKGIYPYDYMDSWSKYNETNLPPKNCFYNTLNMEHISEDEYNHAQSVWKVFDIKTLGDYTDLYLKTDVLLLCDIFEHFRNISLLYYKLDPAYYVSSPSLSWDAMLLYTGVELELIRDLEIYQLLEKGIRGGLAQCSLRHAKANNKYTPHYDDTQASSYLIDLDCNNLYGYAMTKKLPISDFTFLNKNEIANFDVMSIPDDHDQGFILEVDLVYPEHLHKIHKDLPFAAEKFIPPGGKNAKLIANLYDKYHYVIHYVHLKECLKNGLLLKNIHCILSFRQEDFLKKYIDLNTTLRTSAKSTFEKDFFKLLNNAIFGKTIENKRKQVDVKLISRWKDESNKTNKHICAEKLIAKPNLKSISVFSENLVAIQLNREKITLDRPIYIGFTVLEYAKQHLYHFHYNFIKNKYNDNVHLCYTDTDSLLYLIYTEDFYQDMNDNISKFDTSNFSIYNPYNIPRVNAKVPGLFKDELGGEVITEFVGLRAKLYCIHSVKTELKKAKGISKSVTKRLKLSNYTKALFNDDRLRCKMRMIRSIKHVLYSQELNKQVLNRHDDKVQVLSDQVHTIPWGHCDNIF